MRNEYPQLQIHVYGIDGSIQTFVQHHPERVNRTLSELQPGQLFTQDRIKVVGEDSQATFFPPLVTRIDLVTDRFTVWDFPFVLGAPMELTEAEFMECLQNPGSAYAQSDTPVLLDMEMVSGQHSFLYMNVVAGLPAARLNRIYSLLKERRLIFGLRTEGIGVLNLANLVRFSVHPEPSEPANAARSAYCEIGQ